MGTVAEREIGKAVEALLSGAKMISIHCATCRGPLFERGDRIFCPVCGEDKRFPTGPAEPPAPTSGAERVLRQKLDAITAQIEKETDHRKTLELLEEVKSILDALQKMR